jgi:ABC-2 type transport system permease protein
MHFMKKYLTLLKSDLAESLEYRGALLVWMLVEFVSLTSAFFLWTAVFRTTSEVGGYNYSQILTYYLLIPLIGAFVSIYVSEDLPHRIKDGDISMDLMKPYSLAFATFLSNISGKITQFSMKIPLYLVVGFIMVRAFHLQLTVSNMLLAVGVSLFSLVLHFFFDLALSYAAFWFDDTWALSHLKYICMLIFGGQLFPLNLLPQSLQKVFNMLPFRLIYYFPVTLAEGGFTTDYFWHEFSQLIFWIGLFYFVGTIMWKLGLKRYNAYGR